MHAEDTKKTNYDLCFDAQFERFKTMDFCEAARASGNIYDRDQNKILYKYFGGNFTFDCGTGRIFPETDLNSRIEDSLVTVAHFMRYPVYAGAPLSGELVSLKEIPGGGALFFPAFKEMAIDPLVAAFGENSELIYKALEPLKAEKSGLGHASITVYAFPKIPVTIVLWEGDEEIPASATILYDKTASLYAHIEDVIIIGMLAAEKVIRICK